METDDHESHVRGTGVHAQTAKVRTVHPTLRLTIHQGARHAPRAEVHVSAGHPGRQEEPQRPDVLVPRRADERYGDRGERVGARAGHAGRQGGVGQVRANHEQPGERRVRQRGSPGVMSFTLRRFSNFHSRALVSKPITRVHRLA